VFIFVAMNHSNLEIWRFLSRKLGVITLLIVSVVSYATLGDGRSKSTIPRSSLLSNKTISRSGSFSLKSGYSYRGSQVINLTGEKKYIQLNTAITVQKGSTSYIVPLKRKVILDNVKIDISNRQLRRN
jgi:hypothetical protein